jgi:nitrogen fixation protein FixH
VVSSGLVVTLTFVEQLQQVCASSGKERRREAAVGVAGVVPLVQIGVEGLLLLLVPVVVHVVVLHRSVVAVDRPSFAVARRSWGLSGLLVEDHVVVPVVAPLVVA